MAQVSPPDGKKLEAAGLSRKNDSGDNDRDLGINVGLAGRVVTFEDAPVAEAVVKLNIADPKARHLASRSSDNNGGFLFQGLGPGRYTLYAEAGNLAAGPISVTLQDASREIELRMSPGPQVEVEVVSALDASPIAGASGALVVATSQGEAGRLRASSGSDGILRFPTAPLHVERVEVQAEGYVSAVKAIHWLNHTGLIWRALVVLVPGNLIEGLVLDELGDPIARARIKPFPGSPQQHELGSDTGLPSYRAMAARQGGAQLLATVFSDAQGRFAVYMRSGIPLGLQVEHSHHSPMMLEFALQQIAQGPIIVVMKKGHTLAGRTVDRDGNAVPGASVSLQPQAGDVTFSGTDGRFEIHGVNSSQEGMHVYAWTETARSEPVFMIPWQHADVVLQHHLQISGTVSSSERKPVADAVVIYSRIFSAEDEELAMAGETPLIPTGEIRADGGGRFTVGGLAPGRYSIVAMDQRGSEGRIGLPASAMAEAEAGSRNVHLQLPEGTYISGQLIYPDGSAAQAISLELAGFGQSLALNIDADGSFTHGPIHLLAKSQYLLRFTGPAIQDRELQAELEPNISNPLDEIIVQPGRVLSGTLRDTESGMPVAGGLVYVWDSDGTLVAEGKSDDLGLYHAAVPVGRHLRMRALYKRVGASRVEVVGPTTDKVDFQLPEYGEVVVTAAEAAGDRADVLIASAGHLPADIPATWRLRPEAASSARFRRKVPPGDYYVFALQRETNLQQEPTRVAVKVNAGGVTRVTLDDR